jgi:uncharacterized membrane protein YdjX (TVP38/TMEM64 family)
MVLAIFFIILPMVFVHLYAVNCMLEGNCNGFVWVLVGLSVLFTILYVVSFVIKMVKQKRQTAKIAQEHSAT